MPGVGKTQLALKFATLAFPKGQYPYVFWVSAASVEKLTRDFIKLEDLVRLPGRCTVDQASKLTVVRARSGDLTATRLIREESTIGRSAFHFHPSLCP